MADIDDVIEYLCAVGDHRQIFYLWRPVLRDRLDDMVLELAVATALAEKMAAIMTGFISPQT